MMSGFKTYQFADYREQTIDFIEKVCTVSVETVGIVAQFQIYNGREKSMATLILDDGLINQVLAKTQAQNAQEAVTQILSNYLQQTGLDSLAMPEVADIEFEPPRLTTLLFRPADFS